MTNNTDAPKESPLACDMSAIEPARRGRHIATGRELFSAVMDIRELPDGYTFRLHNGPDVLIKTAEFISLEKLCCPFLRFVIEVEPEGGAVWLRLTGREGVKAFIREEVSGLLGGVINWAT
ncbi:MAG TPA: hypothetical protein VFS10_06710 [Pyrinomonadaceae bacterium]|nr:hypothetical protein [Pyrinomonadaceae bacterium]